jgi:hypothetical protein
MPQHRHHQQGQPQGWVWRVAAMLLAAALALLRRALSKERS